VCAQWLAEHPGERYLVGARPEDFPQAKQAEIPGEQFVSSIFGMVTLDPFRGLDPAVKQFEQTRLLAERMFFSLRHMPVLVSWQADLLYLQMLDAPQVRQILAQTGTVAGSTTRFTDSTNKFAAVSGQFADTIEKFRVQLPQQQATLVAQLDGLIAAQRIAALNQATTQVSAQADATIKQLNGTTDAIIKQLNGVGDARIQQLNGVTDATVDRLYNRARSLVLISVGTILAAFVVYRLAFPKRKAVA
jgi:hypothetical protein